jgi:predicted amidohydrolase
MPVRLVALAEGALTGFTDEAFDLEHVAAARELFVDIPGEETQVLADLARHYGTYIVGQCKARWPEVMPDRYFNTLFVIGPDGALVHKAPKNHLWCRERSCTPHDVYSRWGELFGDDIDAFFPVLRTDDIGNLGTICCSDGEYPEAVRALAFNGAEVVYRPSEAVPMTNWGGERVVHHLGHTEIARGIRSTVATPVEADDATSLGTAARHLVPALEARAPASQKEQRRVTLPHVLVAKTDAVYLCELE